MPNHVVVQGEYVAKIASTYGFLDDMAIWNHPNNADLKSKRKNPNVLYPGDVLFIPDQTSKSSQASTDQRHQYTLQSGTLKLRLKILDLNGQPAAGVQCLLTVESQIQKLTSDPGGVIEQTIPRTASTGRLLVKDDRLPLDIDVSLMIGNLDPVDEIEGQQARLNNLGYFAGEPGTTDALRFQRAVEEFQRDNHLTVDGICGPQTQAKLKSVFGC
jgi:hypothetical protein